MELNDTENVFPYIRRNQDNGDPPNIVHLLNNRQLGIRNKPVNQLKQFVELKTTLSEMKETQCQLPQSARSTFLMTFNSDYTKVASTHGDHNIYVCDIQTGKRLNKLVGHRRTPWCISFHPAIKDILASGCLAGEVRVWDLHGGSEKWQADSDQVIASLAFHPSVQLLVIATGNCLYFWDWSKSVPIASCSTYSEIEKVRFVKFDTYGNRLITGITNMSGNKSSMSGMRSALRPCVRLPPETASLLSRSQQSTDSDRLYRRTSEERSRSPRDRENARENSARTRSPVGGSIFPLRQDAVNRFIRHYRGERTSSHRPERFTLNRDDGSTSNQEEASSNRSEMSTSNREELASSNRAEESSPNAIEGETRSYLSALIQDIANDLGEENNLPHGNSSLGSLESVQQNSIRAPQSAPDQYVDGIHRIIVEELNPMMADIHRLSASVAADLEAMGVNLDPDEPQPSTSTGQSRQNNNKFDFLARNREPDSQFFANKDFWDIFLSLRNICSDLERRLINERNNALESESASLEDSEITPLSSDENMERELRSPLTPIIEMLSRLQVNLTFSAITVGAVQDKIRQIRRELAETLSRIRNYIGARCLSHSELDIFQDMTFQLTEYRDKIIEAEDLFPSTNYFDDLFPPGLRRSSGRGTPIGFDEADLAYFNSLADAASDRNVESSSRERSSTSGHSHTTMQHSSDSSFSVRERGHVLSTQAISQSNVTRPSMNRSVSVGSNLDSDASANNEADLSRLSVEAFLEFSRRTQEVCDMVTAMETSVTERDEHVTRGQTSSNSSNLSQNLHETAPNSGGNERNAEACSVSVHYSQRSDWSDHEEAIIRYMHRDQINEDHFRHDIRSTYIETGTPIPAHLDNPVGELSIADIEVTSTSVNQVHPILTRDAYENVIRRNEQHQRSSSEPRYHRPLSSSIVCDMGTAMESSVAERDEHVTRCQTSSHSSNLSQNLHETAPNSGGNERNAEACSVSVHYSQRSDRSGAEEEIIRYMHRDQINEDHARRSMRDIFIEMGTPIPAHLDNPVGELSIADMEDASSSVTRDHPILAQDGTNTIFNKNELDQSSSSEPRYHKSLSSSIVCDMNTAMESSVAERDEHVTRGQTSSYSSNLSQNLHETALNSGGNERNAEACSVSVHYSQRSDRSDAEEEIIRYMHRDQINEDHARRSMRDTFIEMGTPIPAHLDNPVGELSIADMEDASSSVTRDHPILAQDGTNTIFNKNELNQSSSSEPRYHKSLSSSIVCDMGTAMESSVAERDEHVTRSQTSSHSNNLSQNLHETALNSGGNERNAEACSVSVHYSQRSDRSDHEEAIIRYMHRDQINEDRVHRDIRSTYNETGTPIPAHLDNPVGELSIADIEVTSTSVNQEHPILTRDAYENVIRRNEQHQRSSSEARYHRTLSSSIETRRQRQRRIQRASETISLEHQRSPGTRSLSSRIIDLITSQNIGTEAPSRTFNAASSFLSSRNLQSTENVLYDNDMQDMDSVNISSQSSSELVQTSRRSTLSLSNDTENGPVSNEELNPSDNLQTTNTSQSMQPADENLVRPLWPPPIRRNSFITVYPPGNRHMDVASQSTQTPTTSMQTSESAEQSQPADLSDFSEEEMSWSLLDGTNTSPASSPEESDMDFFSLTLSRSQSTRSALRDIIDSLPQTAPRPAFFSPFGASLEPISDPSSDDSERPITPPILMYSPNFTSLLFSRNPRIVFNDPLTQNHRIQVWDFTHFQLPAIYEASTNVVVKRCMIHNDASIDISQDGEKLVALIPPEDRDPFNNLMFGIFSLRPGQIGRILCIWGYISNAISVSFSPLAQYVIVGSAYSRPVYSNPEKTAVAQIIKINQNEDLYDASYIRSFTQVITNENRFQQINLNCVRWLPQSGLGIAYATNRGALCICKPVAGELRDHPNDENESIRDPRSSIYWVNTVNWALMRMWNNDET